MKFFKSKNCPSCPKAEQNLAELMAELGIKEKVETFDISTDDGRIEALNNMVMSSPSIVLNDTQVTKEILLDKDKLKTFFKETGCK